VKNKVAREVNKGFDCASPADFVYAINSNGGIKNTQTTLVMLNSVPKLPKVSIPNVSLLNNFRVEEEGLRCWKAYGYGLGHIIPWKSLDFPKFSGEFIESFVVLPISQNLCSELSKTIDEQRKLHQLFDVGSIGQSFGWSVDWSVG
jgi:hypothetical protein